MTVFSFIKQSLLALSIGSIALSTFAENPVQKIGKTKQGFAIARLSQLSAEIAKNVESKTLPGAVLLLARHGKLVHGEAFGVQDPAANSPMKRDAIFRIYSMTKPFVAVATMMMVEEGKIFLADPVSKHLPELKNLKVGVERTDADGKQHLDLVPATEEMTIQDLLRHTAGFTYGFEGKSLVKDEYKKNQIDGATMSEAAWIAKLATLPLQSQPGSRWEYSIATDVLGVLLARVSGQTLAVLLEERLFLPLRMNDSGFSVAAGKLNRVAQPFEIDPVWKIKFTMNDVSKPPARFSGGGGAVSTADDYLRFAQMLLNGGDLDGVRILSPASVSMMLTDQLASVRRTQSAYAAATSPRPGYGFGLGLAVRLDSSGANTLGSVGIADWNGLGGTNFWIDPKQKIAAIWMAQAPGLRSHYRQLLPNMIYGALVE